MKRYLLCLDMDGTLLDDRGHLGAESAATLERLRARGHVVSFVTGRREVDMLHCQELYRHADYMLLGNGGKLLKTATGKMLFSRTVAPGPARRLMAHCLEAGLQLYVMMGQDYAVTKLTPGVEQYARELGQWPRVFSEVEEIELERVESFMSGADRDAVARFVEAAQLPLCCIASEPDSCDILPQGVGKWSGICRMAGLLEIPRSQIIAVGNYDNDVEMILQAGIGVAVANASSQAQEAADYVTARNNNQDAVAEIASVFLGL